MILSMTGFGSDIISHNNFTLETEIKSFNSRYLDLSVRLPKEFSQYEFDIRDLVKSKLLRGKISVSINITYNENDKEDYSLNEGELTKIVKLLEKIKSSANLNDELTVNQVLLFRENFLDQQDDESEIDITLINQSISRALHNLIEMRGQEGAELRKDLEMRLQITEKSLTEIEDIAKNSTKEYFEKFKEKAKKLFDEFVDDENRFLIELGILSEKHDVSEECTRLRSHIKLFKDTLEKPQDIGRKLNFICQEMNREVNTINSKSINSEISHLGINIKEELEKIREQVQNIE